MSSIIESLKEIYFDNLKVLEVFQNKNKYFKYKFKFKEVGNAKIYLTSIFPFLRHNQEFVYQLLTKAKTKIEKSSMASLVSTLFYDNCVSTKSIEDEHLFIIARCLKSEIRSLDNPHSLDMFLEETICDELLSNLWMREDIKSYFYQILKDIISTLEKREGNNILTFSCEDISKNYQEYLLNKQKNKQSHWFTGKLKDNTAAQQSTSVMSTESEYSGSSDGVIENVFAFNNFKEVPLMSKAEFYNDYAANFKEEDFQKMVDETNSEPMKEYLKERLELEKKNKVLYSNDLFVQHISSLQHSNEVLECFSQYFAVVIQCIDTLFEKLIKSTEILPHSIKSICKIIELCLKHKFKSKISEFQITLFINRFFFKKLLTPIFEMPHYNGLLSSPIELEITKNNIKIIHSIIEHFISGKFYTNQEVNNSYTLFNSFFIKTMPKLLSFHKDVLNNVKLPPIVLKLMESSKTSSFSVENFYFDYFKDNPSETIRPLCIMYNNEHMIHLLNIIEKNPKKFFQRKINVWEQGDATYAKFESSIDKMQKANYVSVFNTQRQKDDDEHLKSYYIWNEIEYCECFQKINKRVKEVFYIDEIKEKNVNDSNRGLSNLIKVKKYLCDILNNCLPLQEYKIGSSHVINSDQLFNHVNEMMNLSYYNLVHKIEKKWNLNELLSLLSNLPSEYIENDYYKLYDELITELKFVNKQTVDYVSEMCILKEKIRYIIKVKDNTHSLVDRFQRESFHEIVQTFIEKEQFPVSCVIKKEKFIINKKPSESTALTIIDFCNAFPDLSIVTKEGIDVFDYATKLGVINELENYYLWIEKVISEKYNDYLFQTYEEPNETIQNENKTLELNVVSNKKARNVEDLRKENLINRILQVIKNFIITKIFDKIYPPVPTTKDNELYNLFTSLSYLQPDHLSINIDFDFAEVMPGVVRSFQDLEKLRTPQAILTEYSTITEQLFQKIQYETKKILGADEKVPCHIFLNVKAQLHSFYSIYKFIELYGSTDYGASHRDFTTFQSVIFEMETFKKVDFASVSTLDEFEKAIEKVNEVKGK